MNFKMPGKVYKTAMSSLATSHMLIAAGTEDVQVRLCDIASGAFAHTLSGHRGMLKRLFFFIIVCPNLRNFLLLDIKSLLARIHSFRNVLFPESCIFCTYINISVEYRLFDSICKLEDCRAFILSFCDGRWCNDGGMVYLK